MRTTQLWTVSSDGTPRPIHCHIPLWVSSSGTAPAEEAAAPPAPDCILLVPLEPPSDACAVALVPDASASLTLVNGARVPPGLHVLRHADHLVVDGRAIWTSIVVTPDEVVYVPRVHGEPLYCLRTKARFEAGDRMVVCRGRPEVDCGMKFSFAAWSANVACHSCGASPAGRDWAPRPASRSKGSLEQLLQLAEEL